MNRKMPLYTILHHVNSFVTEWILTSISTIFCFYFFIFTNFFYKNIAAAVLLYYYTFSIAKLLAAKKVMLYCFSYLILFNLFVFFFSFFISKKKSLSFSFFYPCFNLTRFFEVASARASSSWSSTFGLQTATSTFGIKSRGGFRLKSWTPVSGLM